MGQKDLIVILSLLATIVSSCSSNGNKTSNSDTTVPLETANPSKTSLQTVSKVQFEPFNDVEDVRQKLSAVGIGELGRWRDDEMGGFMSITPYYQFGDGNMPNNLAYYLESDKSSCIKTLKLVLNINNGDKKNARSKFNETIRDTYKALGLGVDTKMINAVKLGKTLTADEPTSKTRIELEKSRIETWKFVIETK